MAPVHTEAWINSGAIAVPIVVAAALIPLRDDLVSTNIALLLVTLVVAFAATGRRPASVLAAVSAATGFNLFFTQPYLSLRIESSDDLETAILLLVVGLMVGEVALRGRRARFAEARGRSEMASMRGLGAMVATGESADYVLLAAADELTHLLGLVECRYERASSHDKVLPVIARDGSVRWGPTPWDTTQWGIPAEGAAIEVWAHGNRRGRFVLRAHAGESYSQDQLAKAAGLVDLAGAVLV